MRRLTGRARSGRKQQVGQAVRCRIAALSGARHYLRDWHYAPNVGRSQALLIVQSGLSLDDKVRRGGTDEQVSVPSQSEPKMQTSLATAPTHGHSADRYVSPDFDATIYRSTH